MCITKCLPYDEKDFEHEVDVYGELQIVAWKLYRAEKDGLKSVWQPSWITYKPGEWESRVITWYRHSGDGKAYLTIYPRQDGDFPIGFHSFVRREDAEASLANNNPKVPLVIRKVYVKGVAAVGHTNWIDWDRKTLTIVSSQVYIVPAGNESAPTKGDKQ